MSYFLKRIDGKEDSNTSIIFQSYNEAYDFLENNFGESCCSDIDFEKDNYYTIEKINKSNVGE